MKTTKLFVFMARDFFRANGYRVIQHIFSDNRFPLGEKTTHLAELRERLAFDMICLDEKKNPVFAICDFREEEEVQHTCDDPTISKALMAFSEAFELLNETPQLFFISKLPFAPELLIALGDSDETGECKAIYNSTESQNRNKILGRVQMVRIRADPHKIFKIRDSKIYNQSLLSRIWCLLPGTSKPATESCPRCGDENILLRKYECRIAGKKTPLTYYHCNECYKEWEPEDNGTILMRAVSAI
ncbi:MAG: hypothetical protein ACE5I5_11445 [Candidatus Heimdallarchaeota archaeon]